MWALRLTNETFLMIILSFTLSLQSWYKFNHFSIFILWLLRHILNHIVVEVHESSLLLFLNYVYTHTFTNHISWSVAIVSQLNAFNWKLIYITSASMTDDLFIRSRFSDQSAQTSWNQLCERTSFAVNLFAKSKFVRSSIRFLRFKSRNFIFHWMNDSRKFFLLKLLQSTFSIWH